MYYETEIVISKVRWWYTRTVSPYTETGITTSKKTSFTLSKAIYKSRQHNCIITLEAHHNRTRPYIHITRRRLSHNVLPNVYHASLEKLDIKVCNWGFLSKSSSYTKWCQPKSTKEKRRDPIELSGKARNPPYPSISERSPWPQLQHLFSVKPPQRSNHELRETRTTRKKNTS